MKTAFPYRYPLELPTFEYGCLMELIIKKETKERQGTLMSNQCLICLCYTMWGNLQCVAVVISWHSTMFYVRNMKEKSVTFFFLKLKAKEKANFSKIIGGEGDFSVKNLGLLFQR